MPRRRRITPAAHGPAPAWLRSYGLRCVSRRYPAARSIHAASSRGRQLLRAFRSRAKSHDTQQNSYSLTPRKTALVMEAPSSRLLSSACFRLPSNEARFCGSEFFFDFQLPFVRRQKSAGLGSGRKPASKFFSRRSYETQNASSHLGLDRRFLGANRNPNCSLWFATKHGARESQVRLL